MNFSIKPMYDEVGFFFLDAIKRLLSFDAIKFQDICHESYNFLKINLII